MVGSIKNSILKTLIYSDIFNFPLTEDEIYKFLISQKPVPKEVIVQQLNKFNKEIEQKDGFWFLKGRSHIVRLRKKREKYAREKIKRANKIAGLISFIPTVQFVGISGGLSMSNVDSNDDIDFFIITVKNTLWSTRFFALILLRLMRLLRTKNNKNVVNKACLNMFIDESALAFTQERQDLYTAHEIVQMMPLFERKNTHQRFIAANGWIKEYMYNAIDIRILRYKDTKRVLLNILISQYLNISEHLTKCIQLAYMRKHRSNETILDNLLAFHPHDYRKLILKEYNKRLRHAKI